MLLIIKVPDFSEAYMDIIPFCQNVDPVRILNCIIDDVNGLLNQAIILDNGDVVDLTAISNTLQYLVNDADGVLSPSTLREIKTAVCYMLKEFFNELSGNSGWINQRFTYYAHTETTSGPWTIRLRMTEVYDLPLLRTLDIMDCATEILEKFSVGTIDRHPTGFSSRARR